MIIISPAAAASRAIHSPAPSAPNGIGQPETQAVSTRQAVTALQPASSSSSNSSGYASTKNSTDTNLNDEIDAWLKSVFGLEFDPFRHVDAAEDERLHEYLVDHELFDDLYQDRLSLVFAPAGGGKSAFRVRLARACRVGEGGRRLLPIVYVLPREVIAAPWDKLWRVHETAILQAGARELFLRLAYRPQEFIQLETDDQKRVVALLKVWLQPPLGHLLEQIADQGTLEKLALGYDATARWPNPPDEATLESFLQALGAVLPTNNRQAGPPNFDEYAQLIVQRLGFDAIFLLVDGVDAYPETFQQPERTWRLLQPLLDRREAFAERRVFLKAFLPEEMEASCPLTEEGTRYKIGWSKDALRLLLQRRMEAASGMTPAGLNMLGGPGLFDLEERVINAVRASPREAVRFVERMFMEHVNTRGSTGRLSIQDFQAALDWYERTSRS